MEVEVWEEKRGEEIIARAPMQVLVGRYDLGSIHHLGSSWIVRRVGVGVGGGECRECRESRESRE